MERDKDKDSDKTATRQRQEVQYYLCLHNSVVRVPVL